jgi:arabinose-5-phosphate isomerase
MKREPSSEDASMQRAIDAGRHVLATCADALATAASRFDAYVEAFTLLLESDGRLVVTGLGKSGLVGAKLAATFSSTGTPALYVHAADALHGDAGMMVKGDVLLALSKSGETREVVHFARLAKERGVQVIAMTGCGGRSSLCRLADAVLDAGVAAEADPFDLVPSTSTTVSIAIGDALAIALMVARGFGPADFLVNHPSGSLGDRLRSEGGS